jgi:hypothetical protein
MSETIWMSRLFAATRRNQTVSQAAFLYHQKTGEWPNFPGVPRPRSKEWSWRVLQVWPWLTRDGLPALQEELRRRGLRIVFSNLQPSLSGPRDRVTIDIIVACKLHKAALCKELFLQRGA